jgi:hypothetical protein
MPAWRAREVLEAAAAALQAPSPMVGAQFVWRYYEDAMPEASDVYTLNLNDLHNVEVVAGEPGAGVARRRGRGPLHHLKRSAPERLPPRLRLV